MERRDDWVDYAKAIGIILVVYGHVARGLYNAGFEVSVVLYELTDSIIYSFHMPLFFFLSGLFFYTSLSRKGAKKLVFNKIDTIFYPYLVWSILQGSIEVFLSNYTNGSVSYVEVFSLLWMPRAQFWFLYALFLVFIAASVIYSMVSKRFSILIFLLSCLLYLFPMLLPRQQVFSFLSQNFVFFSLGIIFTMYANTKYIFTKASLWVTLLVFIICQWLFHEHLSLKYTDKGFESLLLAIFSILFIVSLSGFLSKKPSSLLVFIGTSSMVIYLMHVLAGSGVRVILANLFGFESFFLHLILGCLVGVIAPIGMLLLINKLKIPYVFSAPISTLINFFFNKVFQRKST